MLRAGGLVREVSHRMPSTSRHIYRRTIVTEIKTPKDYSDKMEKDGVVVVQYSASWCVPCRNIKPFLDKFSSEVPEVDFLFIDIDTHPDLAEEAKIMSVPTFMVFKDKKLMQRLTGPDPNIIEKTVKNALN
eukprot:GHVR01188877.1.p1 GENE.GHVR01188877.1~~GHVR01188877.1.p1  ORF type:complete len:149 (+),score=25.24 GHVR01188877.1:55-447(+)